MTTVAAAADIDQYCPGFGHVSRVGVARSADPDLRARRRGPGGLRVLWSVPLDLRSRERHPLYRAAAVPEGSVRAPSQLVWLAAVRAVSEFAGLRADALRSVLAIAEVLAYSADWATLLSRPTHDVLAERAGVSRRTVARVRARLQAAGLVGIVTPGRTSDPVAPDAGPLAQCYVLTVPQALLAQLQPATAAVTVAASSPAGQDGHDEAGAGPSPTAPPAGALTRPDTSVDETVTPSRVTSGDSPAETPARARGAEKRARCARGTTPNTGPDQGRLGLGREVLWPTTVHPTTRTERHLAAAEAHRIDPILRRVSVAHVAALAREWHLAGWTIADLRHALVHRPDGTPWPHSLVAADVRHVPGWVRHRLAAWRTNPADPASPPRLSRAQAAQLAYAAQLAEHAHLAAAAATAAAAALPAGQVDGWTNARADLATRTRTAATAYRHREHRPDDLAGNADDRPGTRPAPTPAPTAGRPAATSGGRAVPARRPVDQTSDPRLAALRAAARAARRPRP